MAQEIDFTSISRINVVGSSGSGKSTFAKKLAKGLDIPYLEMDQIFWESNWTKPSNEVYKLRLSQALNAHKWVLDGNYTQTIPLKWERTELVIWLDYSFSRTLYQAVIRAIRRSWTQQELWQGTGNRENFKKNFLSRDSIIWWMITNHKPIRARYESLMTDPKYSRLKFIRLRNHSQASKLLKSVNSASDL